MKRESDGVNLQFIDEEQVRAVLSYQELIPLMRRALMDYSAGSVQQPLRAVLPITKHDGWFALMPAAYGDVMGAKMVTFYPGNAASGEAHAPGRHSTVPRRQWRAARCVGRPPDHRNEDGSGERRRR